MNLSYVLPFMAPAAPHGKPRCMISSLDLIDGRGPGFPRPRAAKIFGPFFFPQNILFPLKTLPCMYALYICLVCMPYLYAFLIESLLCVCLIPCTCALYVCLICMPYMYALYVCLICMPYMYALSVCLICMPYMHALCAGHFMLKK